MKNVSADNMSIAELDAAIARLDAAISEINERLEKTAVTEKTAKASSRTAGKKIAYATTLMSVLVISFVVCTYAYFVASDSSEGNKISTGILQVTLYDITDPTATRHPDDSTAILIFPGYSVSKQVYATNNGTGSVYVRAQISSTLTLDEAYAAHESEIDMSLITYELDLENWTEQGGYYYYNAPVAAGDSTTSLFSAVNFSETMGNIYKDSTIKINVLLEAVQSENNGDSVFSAEGWTSLDEGGAP